MAILFKMQAREIELVDARNLFRRRRLGCRLCRLILALGQTSPFQQQFPCPIAHDQLQILALIGPVNPLVKEDGSGRAKIPRPAGKLFTLGGQLNACVLDGKNGEKPDAAGPVLQRHIDGQLRGRGIRRTDVPDAIPMLGEDLGLTGAMKEKSGWLSV